MKMFSKNPKVDPSQSKLEPSNETVCDKDVVFMFDDDYLLVFQNVLLRKGQLNNLLRKLFQMANLHLNGLLR